MDGGILQRKTCDFTRDLSTLGTYQLVTYRLYPSIERGGKQNSCQPQSAVKTIVPSFGQMASYLDGVASMEAHLDRLAPSGAPDRRPRLRIILI